MKSAWPGLAILLLLPLNSVSARQPWPQQSQQDDSSSIADAARRAREQKREQPKPAKVWDNDSIPRKPGDVSVIGQSSPAAKNDDSAAATSDRAANPANESASATPGTAPAGAVAKSEKTDRDKLAAEIAAIESELAAAKAHLQTVKADLDILQRKFVLDSQTYYSKPNYVADKDGAASIDAEKAEVEAKQTEVADAQMKVDQLEAKLSALR
jgi:hypothetical protein